MGLLTLILSAAAVEAKQRREANCGDRRRPPPPPSKKKRPRLERILLLGLGFLTKGIEARAEDEETAGIALVLLSRSRRIEREKKSNRIRDRFACVCIETKKERAKKTRWAESDSLALFSFGRLTGTITRLSLMV